MSTPTRQSGAQHINISINASPSPTSSRTMSIAAGLHERRPSDNPAAASPSVFDDPATASVNASGAGGSTLASTARWAQRLKGAVQNSIDGAGQSWWGARRTRGLTSTPSGSRSGRRDSLHTGSIPFSLVHFLGNALSIFYITEEQQAHASRSHHPHSDSDSLPSSSSLAASIPLPNTPAHFPSPSPLLASTTRIPSSYYNPGKRPAALSRTGWLAVTLLFLLGLRELVVLSQVGSRVAGGAKGSIRVRGRDPWAVLKDYEGVQKPTTSGLPGWDTMWKLPLASSALSATTGSGSGLTEANWGLGNSLGGGGAGDTTAIVLHWKRTDNVRVIVAKLCQYEFFEGVFVWNNNPEIRLTREHFASTLCPASRLRIYNSPRNLLFTARYLACLQSSTPYCFFQDDDWIVRPLRALYSQFRRDPEGPVVVHTNEEVASLYGLEWCFFQSPLHTCFSWVGTGAFSAKTHVQRFLHTLTTINYPRDEVGHADNSFTLFQNEPPYVLTSELAQMPSPFGHSDGEGIRRNKGYIHKGLIHLTKYLSLHSNLPPPTTRTTTLLSSPLPISPAPSSYLSSPLPPLSPHPWAHHARSPCHTDICTFLTNIPLLPPPDAIPYPGVEVVQDLEIWENWVGWTARGWMEGGEGEIWKEEETWARRWSYQGAVDGKTGTAFRSPDVVKTHDYIALGLIAALDAVALPRVGFVFVLENVEKLFEAAILEVEVSADGYRWFPPISPTKPSCVTTSLLSTLPSPSFPSSSYLSPLALSLSLGAESSSRWWSRRPKLKECRIEMSSVLREGEGVGRGVEGWRFVRLRAGEGSEEVRIGWGVYEMKVVVV